MDRNNIKSVYLVEEIMEEILSRLPVKSLLRFRCVSKSWLSLISSKRFIHIHYLKSTNNKAVIFKSKFGVFKQCSLQQLLNEPSSIEPSPIHDPMNHQLLREGACVVGCCNGLFCILKTQGWRFYLWNPATKISIELPKLDHIDYESLKFGFGWDGKSGAYKVFSLNNNRGIWRDACKGNVYSSKTGSWKTVGGGCSSCYTKFGVFACGKIHWEIETSKSFIETFDLESEDFGRIELPFKPPNCCLKYYALAEIRGCLHLLCVHNPDYDHDEKSCLDLWVMKGSCWLKMVTLNKFLFFAPNYFHHVHPLFGGGPNGEILFIYIDNFLIYDPNNDWQLLGAGKTRTGFYGGHVYVESLESPNFTI